MPEPQEGTMAVVSFTWGLVLTELEFRCEDIHSSEQ